MKTYFITGISGFLGRNITIELLKQKDVSIVGFVLPNEKNLEFYEQHENITLVKGNLLDRESINQFLSTPASGDKYLIHAAGRISVYRKNDPLTMNVNVEGTRNVIELSLDKGFKKVVYVSSVDSIPRKKGTGEIIEPEIFDIEKVDGVYSKSKVLANEIVLDAVREHDLNACIVLPSAMIGPNDPFSNPINSAIEKFLNDKMPAIVNGGYNLADVRDVAKGILLAIDKGVKGESYLLAGQYTSIKELFKIVGEITNKKPVKATVPHWVIKIASPFIEMNARAKHKTPLFTGFSMDCLKQNSNYSSKKAINELGYQITPLEATLKDTVQWLRNKDEN